MPPAGAAVADADFSIFHDDVKAKADAGAKPAAAPAAKAVDTALPILTVSAVVTNTGKLAGDEVVQLYVRSPEGSGDRRIHHLEGFQRVSLKPGESKKVTFKLSAGQLAQFGTDARQTLAKGVYRIFVGGGQPGYTDNTRCAFIEL